MKKWAVFLVVFMCFGVAIDALASLQQDEVKIKNAGSEPVENVDANSTQTVEVDKDEVYRGELVLINKTHPVAQEGVKNDMITLMNEEELTKGYGLLNTDITFSKSVTHQFSKMIDAARKDDVHHFIINSGYRSLERQSELYKTMGSDYALPPGFSEHNSGLALDVGSTQAKMGDSPEGEWIEHNAWRFGFVIRYPEDKTHITGIEYEPWHIRYVGLPHSAIMYEKNFVLEEYLQFLKEDKTIQATVADHTYTVTYYQVTENLTVQVPTNHYYEISGNNVDGVIVTVTE